MSQYFLSIEEALDEDETALQDQVPQPVFKDQIEKLFFEFYNTVLLNEAKGKAGLPALLDSLNLLIESRLGAKLKDIISQSDFCYYLDVPMQSTLRQTSSLEKAFNLSEWLKTLDIATEGEIKEDGRLIGAHKASFNQITLYMDLVSMIKTRHLTKAEALSLFVKYLCDAEQYIQQRVVSLELLKLMARVAVKVAKHDDDIEKEKELLKQYDEQIVSITSADSLFSAVIRLILQNSLTKAYSNTGAEYTESALMQELALIEHLPRAMNKMSGTSLDASVKTEHRELVDACLDLISLRKLTETVKLDKQLEEELALILKRHLNSLIDVTEYSKLETESSKESDRLIKYLLGEANKRLKANVNLSEELKSAQVQQMAHLVKALKKTQQENSLVDIVAAEAINLHSATLSDYSVRPALEMIYPQKHNDPAFLKIDNIFAQCLQETSKKRIQKLLDEIPPIVEKRFGIKLSAVHRLEREFNYYASVPIISESTQLLTGLYNHLDHELLDEVPERYTSGRLVSNLLKRLKQNSVSLDLKNAKWSGLTTIADDDVYIGMDIGAARLANMTPRQVSAIFFHELGHVFTYYEYSYRANRTNLLLLEVFEQLNAPSGQVEYIFQRVGELAGNEYDKKQIEEALTDPNKKAIFLGSLTFKAYSSFTQDIRRNLMTAANSEQLADSFSSRLGYESEIITGLDALFDEIARQMGVTKADIYKNYNESYISHTLIRTLLMAGRLMAYASLIMKIVSLLNPSALALTIVKTVITFLLIKYGFNSDFMEKGIVNVDLDYNSVKRTTRAMREVVKRLKDSGLKPDEQKRLLTAYAELEKVMNEVASYVQDVERHSVLGPVHSNVMNLLLVSNISRADTDLYYLQLELEKMLDNPLFVAAAKLNTYEKQ